MKKLVLGLAIFALATLAHAWQQTAAGTITWLGPDGHLKLPHLWPGQTPAPEQVAGRGEVTRLARAWQLAPRLL